MSFLKLSKIRASSSSLDPPPVAEADAREAAEITNEVDNLFHPAPTAPVVDPTGEENVVLDFDSSEDDEEEAGGAGESSSASKKNNKKKKTKRGPNQLSKIPINPNNRITLKISSDTVFVVDTPGVKCTQLPRDLTVLLKMHTKGWPTYSAWHPDYKKIIINEIKARYKWAHPNKDDEYVSVVHSYAFRRYKDILNKARRDAFRHDLNMGQWISTPDNIKKIKPFWMKDEPWIQLVKHWVRPEWQNESSQKKANRNTANKVITNRAGSISVADVYKNMTEANDGKKVPYVSLVRQTKVRNTAGPCDPKTERNIDNYNTLMTVRYGEGWMQQGVDDDMVWLEAIGGLDHGNIHGLRAVIDKKKVPAASLRPNASHYTVGELPRMNAEEVQRERESLRKEREEWRKEKEEWRREREEWRREKEGLRRDQSSSQWGAPSYDNPTGPSSVRPSPTGFLSTVTQEWNAAYRPTASTWNEQLPSWTPVLTRPPPPPPLPPPPLHTQTSGPAFETDAPPGEIVREDYERLS